jgi:hypothetical protein
MLYLLAKSRVWAGGGVGRRNSTIVDTVLGHGLKTQHQ